jgi:hypothetical protein
MQEKNAGCGQAFGKDYCFTVGGRVLIQKSQNRSTLGISSTK